MKYVLFLCLLFASTAVFAELVDPTRPPFPVAGSVAPDGASEPAQGGLNTVVIAREGVLALKDGRVIRVGSRIEEGVVTRITQDAVYVRSGQGKALRLPVWPDVKIDAVQVSTQAKSSAAGRSRK